MLLSVKSLPSSTAKKVTVYAGDCSSGNIQQTQAEIKTKYLEVINSDPLLKTMLCKASHDVDCQFKNIKVRSLLLMFRTNARVRAIHALSRYIFHDWLNKCYNKECRIFLFIALRVTWDFYFILMSKDSAMRIQRNVKNKCFIWSAHNANTSMCFFHKKLQWFVIKLKTKTTRKTNKLKTACVPRGSIIEKSGSSCWINALFT